MKKPRILIADDDRAMRAALRTRLTAWGYSAVEASDGLGVLSLAAPNDICAVILDQQMPRGDGLCIARLIRHECAVPIIFLSGQARGLFAAIQTELPDMYVLSKPFDAPQLKDLLDKIVDTTSARRICQQTPAPVAAGC